MGQLYSKLNQLIINDVDTASDPDRCQPKLETAFTTPARSFPVRLADPRSVTQHIDRTPIIVTVTESKPSETPKFSKPSIRPRYLETDLDEILPVAGNCYRPPVHPRIATMTTSTPVQRKVLTSECNDTDGEINDVVNQVVAKLPDKIPDNSLSFRSPSITDNIDDPGNVTYEEQPKSEQDVHLATHTVSYAEEVIVTSDEVTHISCVDDVVEVILGEADTSLIPNWSGIGGPDRTVGVIEEICVQNIFANSESAIFCSDSDASSVPLEETWEDDSSNAVESDLSQNESLVVHKDSLSFDKSCDELHWDSNGNDSLLIASPAPIYHDMNESGIEVRRNQLSTPQKNLANVAGPRTPLGDVSTNSPILNQQQTLTPKQKLVGKIWKNMKEERVKRGLDSENTPPNSKAFSSYPPEVVQSAPAMRSKHKTKWANDSMAI